MAGGSPAPYQQEDSVSHTNPTYDANEDGTVDAADDADTVDGEHAADVVTQARVDAVNPDADTVDGQHANQLGKSTDEIQKETMIHNEGFAPGFGG